MAVRPTTEYRPHVHISENSGGGSAISRRVMCSQCHNYSSRFRLYETTKMNCKENPSELTIQIFILHSKLYYISVKLPYLTELQL